MGLISRKEEADIKNIDARTGLSIFQTNELLAKTGSNLDAANLKENQAKHLLHLSKMENAGIELRNLIDPNNQSGLDPTSFWSGVQDVFGAVPFGNYLMSGAKQQYDSASNAWVQSILRPESGAAIPPEELKAYIRTYIPRAGDSPETVQAKLRLMANTEKAMRTVLSIQGLDPKQVFVQLRQMAPASDLKLLKTLNTKQDIRDAVDNRVLTESEANDIMNLKGLSSSKGNKVLGGWTIESLPE